MTTLLGPVFFGPITWTSFTYAFIIRGLIASTVFVIEPFAAAVFDAYGENVDAVLSKCVDNATRLQAAKFDKIFDALMIVIFWLYMLMIYMNTLQKKKFKNNYNPWFWVYPLLWLIPYRLLGIVLFFLTDNFWMLVVFSNVWLLYFFFFTALKWIGWLEPLYQRKNLLVFFIVVIFVWKVVEEYLHHITSWADEIYENTCTGYFLDDETPVNAASILKIFQIFGTKLIVLIVVWALSTLNKQYKWYKKKKSGELTKMV